MLNMDDWAEVRRLHRAEGISIKEIARRMGLARNTVRTAVRSDAPPSYERKGRGSRADAHEPAIRALLGEFPHMPATVIAERIGWSGGHSVLRARVAELRPIYLPADPCQRTEYRPGELAQWDLWFPAARIPLGHGQDAVLPVIVGVSGYSRVMAARMIPSRKAYDILLGHLACLLALGGVPRKGVYDNEAALVSRHSGRPNPTQAFQRFRGALGMGVVFCKPGDPEAKGLVERANQYLETSFMPGRRFDSPADFNAQLGSWLPIANDRVHSTLRCRPSERLVEDRAAMMALPAMLPDPAWGESRRLGRDHWVRVDSCDYSVHPRAIGRRINLRLDLKELVVTCAGDVVARHDRSWARNRTITDPAHDAARKAMAAAANPPCEDDVDLDDVEAPDLSAYDRATGAA